ncbi:hypothetical protein [Microbispora hainanensis]|uniref:Uncharacterized protein n=1 Tax=Microbispora hainanensis TaxID=568844 RepID=A0A544Z2K3_9ACTN|nr:hypothetical protein [Microbispora hainanensis]TQS23289.1 hypothetical protein FLX08_05340 [Microbispora hainanensis]
MHEHSGYSDGWPGSRPADYFGSGRDKHDLNFVGSSEHWPPIDVGANLCPYDAAMVAMTSPVYVR